MWSYNYSDELYHHGVKGMKWGVRHDRELVGRKNKHIITNDQLQNYKQKTIDQQDRLLSEEQKWKNRHRKEQMLKIGLAVAATAGIGAGICFAYKHGSIKQISNMLHKVNPTDAELINIKASDIMKQTLADADEVFAKGSKFHRMSAYKDVDFSKQTSPLYTAYTEKDVLTYMTKLKDWSGTGERYDATLEAVRDLKFPSQQRAQQIFEELYKNDPTYKEELVNTITKTYKSLGVIGTDASIRHQAESWVNSDPFEAGIYSIVRREKDSQKLINLYKSKGYAGIEDYFDKGSMSDFPVIIFDPSSSVVKTGERKVDDVLRRAARRRLIHIT